MDLLRSLPIGLYLEQPETWLHRIDPRVKLAWLMTFLIAPLLANPVWRLALVGLLMLITLSAAIPLRVWRKQMGWLILLCSLIFAIACIAPDGLAVESQPRTPQFCSEPVENPAECPLELPQPTSYRYTYVDRPGFLFIPQITITRRSLDIAVRVSTLFFTLIYSTNLYLLTTAPEEITAGLEDLMKPLRWFKLPVSEIALTLTLSLRFIPLVLEEIQNLVRSIRTRAIDWKKLGLRRSFKLWLVVAEKLLENLLLRSEQIATAMDVRGFTSPNEHKVQWHHLKLRWRDWLALAVLIPFWFARWSFGGMA
ncbi:energy-coupling factor transporter transmembrane protein EcfT [Myxosarcina sp. GI1]|uniref:energy-coupling factor transporter transmembrane component T family protein n=1 Tax=Myxosarcina sp. GI1 TaxID=1541065 RepID=UPI00055CCEEE|nr:energy-coupling factor transporter transmembrane protein EcfT [Myxosarcina sp. GI1]